MSSSRLWVISINTLCKDTAKKPDACLSQYFYGVAATGLTSVVGIQREQVRLETRYTIFVPTVRTEADLEPVARGNQSEAA